MRDISPANAYFQRTTRKKHWFSFHEIERWEAIEEAAGILSRLSYRSRPPVIVMDSATYEQALFLLQSQRDGAGAAQAAIGGVRSRSIGNAAESYAAAKDIPGYVDGVILCPNALSWLGVHLQIGKARGGRITLR